jgi:hypothetical protein
LKEICHCQTEKAVAFKNDFFSIKTHIKMSYNSSAQIYVVNNTGGNANIHLVHRYSSDTPQSGSWTHIPTGKATPTPLAVGYNTGFLRTGMDWWWIGVEVLDGPNKGYYVSPGSADDPDKECMLESEDNGKALHFTVDTETFLMSLISGSCSTSMRQITKQEAYYAKQSVGKTNE